MNLLEQKLSRIDLNLLVSLSVLLKEKSVSRAAERLYLSQSAMSRTLQRLRDLFEDPLFHRTSTGIVPTVKAQSIEVLLPDLLQKLEYIFQNDEFDPIKCEQHFSISIPSLMSHAFLLPLLQDVSSAAPMVKITEHSAKINPFKHLELGSLDFAIHVDKPIDKNFAITHLGAVVPVIFARKSHPLAIQHTVNLKDCFDYTFLDLNIESNPGVGFTNPIDTMLLKLGFHRDIHIISSQFSILTQALKRTDNLLIGPHFLFDEEEFSDDFTVIYQFEKSIDNTIDLYLLEHNRVQNSPAHQWFKQLLLKHSL